MVKSKKQMLQHTEETKEKIGLALKMTYEEFKKQYVANTKWKFDLFKIVCNKCNSDKVEFNSDMELEEGYYDTYSVEGKIIVKCHDCGNAFTLDFADLEKD